MKYLKIGHYVKVLLTEGTKWEYREILSTTATPASAIKKYSWIKRLIISLPVLLIIYFLKNGFNDDFLGYVMTAMSIFIGLFTNLIIVLYQRFASISKGATLTLQSDLERINTVKIKNFIKQFTFVTGKNLLISTVVIVLISVYMLFSSLAVLNLFNYNLVSQIEEVNTESIMLSLEIAIAFILRFAVLYLLLDFCTLLLYTLGSLFAFLKGEYTQE